MFLDKMMKIKKELMQTVMQPKCDVFNAFKSKKFNIIAEVKKASPSKNDIKPDANITEIAKSYNVNGATMVSVLTETEYFKGSVDDFKQIRSACPDTILLRKDFIMDEFQVYESKIIGADVILIILAFIGKDRAKELIALAKKLGLEVLVEVHNEDEMKDALELDTNFIGVNNRNLKTLEVSLDVARYLSKYITSDKIFVCESGIETSDEITEMINLGYKAFLIGSHFMFQGEPGDELNKLITEVNSKC